jgi:hypothetical protein
MAKHLYALFNVAPYDEFGRPALRPGHIPNRDTFVTFVTEMPYTGTPKLKDFFNENGEQIEYNMRVFNRASSSAHQTKSRLMRS